MFGRPTTVLHVVSDRKVQADLAGRASCLNVWKDHNSKYGPNTVGVHVDFLAYHVDPLGIPEDKVTPR